MFPVDDRIRQIQSLARAVGSVTSTSIWIRRALRIPAPVRVSAADNIIRVRPCDSDPFVALQVFGDREYDLGAERTRIRGQLAAIWKEQGIEPVIVDAGANVGYSSLYFAKTFPEVTVLAVEPDEVTFRELQHNCGHLPRVKPFHAALWNHENGVSLQRSARLKSWAPV
jgi:hypothetical protein